MGTVLIRILNVKELNEVSEQHVDDDIHTNYVDLATLPMFFSLTLQSLFRA